MQNKRLHFDVDEHLLEVDYSFFYDEVLIHMKRKFGTSCSLSYLSWNIYKAQRSSFQATF